jgi:hypothetical protein
MWHAMCISSGLEDMTMKLETLELELLIADVDAAFDAIQDCSLEDLNAELNACDWAVGNEFVINTVQEIKA